MSYEHLQRMYAGDGYYWGREPNDFARRCVQFLPRVPEGRRLRAVDIGAGEGRDAVFFAGGGLDVLAVDVTSNGLEKATRLAEETGIDLSVEQADINTLCLLRKLDLVYSIGTLQYLPPENREKQFGHLRELTSTGGIHALFVFVEAPGLPSAPDWGTDEHLYAPGELPGYYAGWECLYSRSFVFDDYSGGAAHQHAAEEYVFKKIAENTS